MGARVTASEKEVEEQKKEVTALREELSITTTQQQLQKNKVEELEKQNAGTCHRDVIS